jgi:hypothetical protein
VLEQMLGLHDAASKLSSNELRRPRRTHLVRRADRRIPRRTIGWTPPRGRSPAS